MSTISCGLLALRRECAASEKKFATLHLISGSYREDAVGVCEFVTAAAKKNGYQKW
jgi:hypothetical protein